MRLRTVSSGFLRDGLCTTPCVRYVVCAVVLACLAAATPRAAERETARPTSLAALVAPTRAVVPVEPGEELGGPDRVRARWVQAPELVVLMSVMQYHTGPAIEYTATSGVLTDEEADGLIADMTEALAVMTNHTFTQFKAVRREATPPGSSARIVRPGQIVVGRYEGIRALRQTIGFGGRVPGREREISSAAVLLDSDYDRSGSERRLLRIHELGHALGYDHVDSQPSIMNARIGTAPTDFDLEMARAWVYR